MDFTSSLEVRQTRALAMTAQLRQAIGLLQFNNAELSRFLARETQRNPLIEVRLGQARSGERSGQDRPGNVAVPADGTAAAGRDAQDTLPATSSSLQEHVATQIGLNIHSPEERQIAQAFLEALEPYGWLGAPVSDIAADRDCSEEEAENVLRILQGFEPAGIFARSLGECLRLQAEDQGHLDGVMECLLDRLDLVAEGRTEDLATACGCSTEDVAQRVETLKHFDPKPGASFDADVQPIRAPDLLLRKAADGWSVELNATTLPEIIVHEDRVADTEQRDAFVAEALANARGLKRAIEQRNANTLAVAAEIIRRQEAYLNEESRHVAPLSLKDVAKAVSLHESTVSRVTAGMTIDTPHGLMDLRRFFSRGISGGSGAGGVAITAIKERIAEMIRAEPRNRPMSDEDIGATMRHEGMDIQRRTVAKYRKALGIPTSVKRRREGRARNRG